MIMYGVAEIETRMQRPCCVAVGFDGSNVGQRSTSGASSSN